MWLRGTRALTVSLLMLPIACDTGGADPSTPSAPEVPHDGVFEFVATELNFHYPDGITEAPEDATNVCGVPGSTDNSIYKPLIFDEIVVDGFDMDGVVSTDDEGLCGQADFIAPDGTEGVDYAFLHVIDMIRPIRPDQLARGVLAQAPSEGLINFGIRVSDVDDLQNDDHVELMVITTVEPPVLGTDGEILPWASVTVDNTPEWRTDFTGQLVDGVLTTEPSDVVLGDIDLLVIEDRVLRLKDAQIRGTITENADGSINFDSLISCWWDRENMADVIGTVVLAIGANIGELDCAFHAWADHSSDGESCDLISIIFEARGISGFLTGLDEPTP